MIHHDVQPIITSRNHLAVRRIRHLSSRAERERTGLFYVEGLRFVAQALQHRARIDTVVVCPALLARPFGPKLLSRLRRTGTPILAVTPEVLQSLALVDDPQGIGAVIHQRWERLERVTPARDLCWLVLDTVHSPGNLGSILRTSDAVGGTGLIALGNGVDPYDPASVRASMGAIFSQRFVRATLDDVLAWKQRHSCRLVGTSPSAPTDYREVFYQAPMLLLMGGERKGLSPGLQARCDDLARIPIVGRSDSLNLAVATGVMLYEIYRRASPRNAHPPLDLAEC